MALTTPILYSQVAFDATNSQTFNFGVIGGEQVTQNKLVITNQSTNKIVYQAVQTTYKFEHILPANTLTNGVYYSAYIVTYNANGTASAQSNSIQFYCYSTPSFAFSNLPINNVIANSSYNFRATYNQAEGELLNSYVFTLYDAQRTQIATSGVRYVGNTTTLPTIVSYRFTGFIDKTSYYIRAIGQTAHGVQVDTGFIAISIIYTAPNLFSVIELSNNCSGGYVLVKSNLIEIGAKSNPIPPIYIDNNTAVDGRNSGRYVQWDSGFELSDDFTASLWGRAFNENSNIITMIDDYDNEIVIRYRTNDDGTVYADATVTTGSVRYYIYSASIPKPTKTDKIQFWIRRIGYQYTIKLANVTT